jgi:CubicO group peptidase (beta-lactamase class C family)
MAVVRPWPGRTAQRRGGPLIYLKTILATLAALAVWTGALVVGAVYGWWTSPAAPTGDADAFLAHALDRLAAADPGNAALVLIEDGTVFAEHFHTVDEPVNRDTIFPVASMSKWLTAWAVMTLVEEGRLDLDRPVDDYLTRWHLPPGEYDNRGVTARRLLSHTAGLTDGLGFADYLPDEDVPSLVDALSEPRASSGEPVRIATGLPPGAQWEYSGGGYLVLELLVEQLSGERFEDFVQRRVFGPLGMNRSTYRHPADLSNTAESYTTAGRRAPLYRYAAASATGLATSAGDLTRFLLAHLEAAGGGRPLSRQTLAAMRTPEGFMLGQGFWGLGPILYAPVGDDFVFGHDGGNEPAINATARLNPLTRDGIVMLETGDPSLATSIGEDWVLWQTGVPGVFSQGASVQRVMPAILIGWGAILVAAIVLSLRRRRRRSGG